MKLRDCGLLAVVTIASLFATGISPAAMASGWGSYRQIHECTSSGDGPDKVVHCSWVNVWFPPADGVIGLGSSDGGATAPIGGGGSLSVSANPDPTADKDKDRNKPCANKAGHHPIEISHMAETLAVDLFKLPGEMGLSYSLYYTSPRGWYDNLGYWLDTKCGAPLGGGGGPIQDLIIHPPGGGSPPPCTHLKFNRPDGSSIVFSGTPGTVGNYPEEGGGGLATLVENADYTYTLHDENAWTLVFSSGGALESIKDESGVGWTVGYDGLNRPALVTRTDGTYFTISRQNTGQSGYVEVQTTVTDPAGNAYHYTYTSNKPIGIFHNQFRLTSLSLPGLPATTIAYQYRDGPTYPSTLLTEVDYNSNPYFYVTYDSASRAIGTREAGNTADYSIVYTVAGTAMTAKITNPLGHTTTKQYNSIGGQYMLTSVGEDAVSTCGATTQSLAYDSDGLLTKTIDNRGIAHTYSYAVNGQLQSETEASGTTVARKFDYTWDSNQHLNRLLGVAVAGESKTSDAYNAQNRLASVSRTNLASIGTANQALTTTYAYVLYSNGMVKTMTVTSPSPGSTDKTTYQYDTHGNVTSVTDGLGHVAAYFNYNALGEVGKTIGPNGDETDYAYDARGRVASKTTHLNGGSAVWAYAYDGFGLLNSVSAPDGQLTTVTRNASMRVTQIAHNDKDGASTETVAYDAMGNVTSDVIARGGDVGKKAIYLYDGLGRLDQAKGASGQAQATYAYDGNGNVLSVTDALNHKTSYAYDALNRLSVQRDPANQTTKYTYDVGDHVTHVTDPRGLVTGYAWDGLGQLWQVQSPDTGTTNYGYDAYGRLSSFIRADNTQTILAYDALNRLTGRTAAGQTQTFTWDVCTHGLGRLCTATTSADQVDYSYTPEGQVAARAFSFTNGPVYTLGYSYDAMGQLTTVAYPDGNQAIYDYSHGVVADVRMKVGSSTVYGVTGVSYRPMDMAMSAWTSYNGLANMITYDSDLRPMAVTVPGVESLTFSYDNADRITNIANGVDASLSQAYVYDTLNRLQTVTSGADNESINYDPNGNRMSQVVNGQLTTYNIATTSNRLQSSTAPHGQYSTNNAYGYDAQGNLTVRQTYTDAPIPNPPQSFYYDSFNRLRQSYLGGLVATYDVSAEGQRLRKSTVSSTTYFAPDQSGASLADYQDGVWRDYVWLNGRMVVMIAGGGVYSLHGDQTGRVLAITDPNSHAVVWKAEGLAFDRNTIAGSAAFFRLGFQGQYWDVEDNLWHNGARDYDPWLGRYIESDPIGLLGGVNTYAYVGSNPISSVDPLGLCDDKKCGTPPKLPPGQSVKANIQTMGRLSAQAGASGDPFYTGLFSEFNSFVGYGGKWDYKTQGPQYENGGNFNYGAVGAAAGFSTPLLRIAAAVAQIGHGSSHWKWVFSSSLGDQPHDVPQILAGIAYYQCMASGGP